jgi:4a-hydroxytetrahydrobiopterin dehydratase
MRRLTAKEARKTTRNIEGWRLQGKALVKTYNFPNYLRCVRFFNRVAALAEKMNHNPDVYIGYGRLVLKLITHDVGGLTLRDIKMAREINRLEEKYGGKTKG